jgi:ATP-dependent DNA helicase DinG
VQSRLVPAAHGARDKADLVFDLLQAWVEQQGQPVVRFGPAFATDPIWAAGLDAALTDLLGDIELLHENLRLVRERLEVDERRSEQLAPLLGEVRAVARRLASAGDGLSRALRPEAVRARAAGERASGAAEDSVRWVELRGKEKNVVVTAVPLDLAPILREDLFKRMTTAVITSATLATRGSVARGASSVEWASRSTLDAPRSTRRRSRSPSSPGGSVSRRPSSSPAPPSIPRRSTTRGRRCWWCRRTRRRRTSTGPRTSCTSCVTCSTRRRRRTVGCSRSYRVTAT